MKSKEKISEDLLLEVEQHPDSILDELDRVDCRESFYFFLKYFWDVIIEEEFQDNWHIKYLCDELQEIGIRAKNRYPTPYNYYIINIPPGTSKSTIVTIMFPVWCWVIDPSLKFITSSYSEKLSTDHAVYSRDIIRSEKFRRLFPGIEMKEDRDNKTEYQNKNKGLRIVSSVGGTATGHHAHIIIIDDPLNPKQASSDVERDKANRWLSETMSTRKVSKSNTPTIIIMQRLHENDCTGYILSRKRRVKHICLPGEKTEDVYPKELKKKYVNGLLDPVRLGKNVLAELKTDLGSYGYAGQILQRPSPAEGAILKKSWFNYFSTSDLTKLLLEEDPDSENPLANLPRHFYSDTGYGKEGSDKSATVCYSVYKGMLYIWDMWVTNLSFPDFKNDYIDYIISHGYTDYSICRFEPKATGISTVQELQQIVLSNGGRINVVEDDPPSDSKVTRTMAVSPIIEAGRVKLHRGESWIEHFLNECASFPNGINDDQVDVLTAIIRIELQNSIEVDLSFV